MRELEDIYQLGYGIHASVLTEDSPIRRTDGTLQPSGTDALYTAVETLVAMPADERQSIFTARREQMLREKIDYASSKQACNKEFATLVEVAAVPPLPITTHCAGAPVITWFIENYPQSAKETKDNQQNEAFWEQFK